MKKLIVIVVFPFLLMGMEENLNLIEKQLLSERTYYSKPDEYDELIAQSKQDLEKIGQNENQLYADYKADEKQISELCKKEWEASNIEEKKHFKSEQIGLFEHQRLIIEQLQKIDQEKQLFMQGKLVVFELSTLIRLKNTYKQKIKYIEKQVSNFSKEEEYFSLGAKECIDQHYHDKKCLEQRIINLEKSVIRKCRLEKLVIKEPCITDID